MTERPGRAEDEEGVAAARAPLTRYRLAMLLAIVFVFALQQFIAYQKPYALARLLGVEDLWLIKKWLGVLVTFLLVAVLVEYVWAIIPRLVRRRSRLRLPVRSAEFL